MKFEDIKANQRYSVTKNKKQTVYLVQIRLMNQKKVLASIDGGPSSLYDQSEYSKWKAVNLEKTV